MKLTFREAKNSDAFALTVIRNAAAEALAEKFGEGHWSSRATETGILYLIRNARVIVVLHGKSLAGMLALWTKKPWAIDKSYFAKSKRPLYLTNMVVHPAQQRRGIGRAMLDETRRIAGDWPADAIRLDAYDAPAGAGEFYVSCGFTEVGRVKYRNVPLIYYELLV